MQRKERGVEPMESGEAGIASQSRARIDGLTARQAPVVHALQATAAHVAAFAVRARWALLVALAGGALAGIARADEPPLVTLTTEQAQARQFGMFFGGTASQFDLCVQKGFLSPGKQSAEDIAQAVLQRIRAANTGTDQSAFVQEGWDTMKKEITDNESFYTQARCASVGKAWAKLMANLPKK